MSASRGLADEQRVRTSVASGFGVEEEFGFVPRYAFDGRDVSLSELPLALRSARSLTLDYPAINVFLRTSFYMNGTTPFRELRRFWPAPVTVAPSEISRDAALDAYIALFAQAVRRRTSAANTVALSGGRDSRHILLELAAQGAPRLQALSVELEMNEDASIARRVAECAGVSFKRVPPSRSLEDAEYTVEATGFGSMEHAWIVGAVRERDDSAWWDGIAGDVLSAGHFLTDWNVRLFAEGKLDELADRLVSQGKVPYFRDQSLFPREDVVQTVHAELRRHEGAANPVGSFYLWNRTRGNVAASAFGLLRPGGAVTHAPFLDRDVWQFLSSLPLELVSDYQFHTDAILRAYPNCRDIPFAGKKPADPQMRRVASLRLLSAIVRRKPSTINAVTAVRAVRGVVAPARAHDIDWVVPAWVYGESLTRLVSEH